MATRSKRKFSTTFKVKVALEAVKGRSTLADLSKEFELHPSQIMEWKKTLIAGSESLFSTQSKANSSNETANSALLYEQIGRLQVELNFLKKKLGT